MTHWTLTLIWTREKMKPESFSMMMSLTNHTFFTDIDTRSFFFCCRVEKYKSQKNEKTLTTKMWVTQRQLKNDLHTLLCIIKKVDG